VPGEKHKVELAIPLAAVSATIRVLIRPPSGAVLISNSIMADEAIRFDGPYLIGHIPVEMPDIFIELIDGAQDCFIETLGYEADLDGSRRAHRERLRLSGKVVVEAKPAILDERQRFYAAIGFAVSQWQHVEAALANILIFLVVAGDWFAANAAFFSSISFAGKLDMVDAAAQKHLLVQPDLLTEWGNLRDEALSKSKLRNNFAHYMSAVRIAPRDKYRLYLEPSILNTNNQGRDTSPRYNFVNIEDAARSFGETAQRLMDFLPKLAPRQSP
jgi:hypothetical protein